MIQAPSRQRDPALLAIADPRVPLFAALQAAAPDGLLDDPGNVLAFNNLLDAFGVPRAQPDHGDAS